MQEIDLEQNVDCNFKKYQKNCLKTFTGCTPLGNNIPIHYSSYIFSNVRRIWFSRTKQIKISCLFQAP